ncbi:hypothetical protein GTR00_01360 [Kineococcus sp. T90]|nr:hypothetical protein [Kineococcus indalonis]
MLLTRAGSVVPVDRLVDVVWGEGASPERCEAALHNLVSRLRARLRGAGPGVELLHRPPGYLLAVERDVWDATRFDDLVGAAGRESTACPQRALLLLDEALALWRGGAYAEFADDDFARPEVARLEEARRNAADERAEAALLLGLHHAVTAALESVVLAEPLRERPHRQLVLAHYRAGRHADALGVARLYRDRLQEELGLDPSAAMVALEAAVLRQDPSLTRGPPGAPPGEVPGGADPPDGAPGGAGAPGPVPARPAPPAAVPVGGPLLGREQELAQLGAAVRPGALVTLTGPGGVGKTSLAQQVVARCGGAFRDGAVVVELAAVSAPEDLAPAAVTALQLQPRQGAGSLERLVEHLRPLSALVVLDNCEHLVEEAAALAGAVTAACAGVAVLATSRCPLEVAGERIWAVSPLPPPAASATSARDVLRSPAVQLFDRRARQRCRTFAVDDSNAADVAELCRRLDGLPLAIELAAARMNALRPADLLSRLSWRFRLLRGGPRGAGERHRTLHAVVDWSYDLLDERSRALFDVLCAFAGAFPLGDAELLVEELPDVAGTVTSGGSVAEVLASLVDRSMVVLLDSGDGTRYGLLETLRAYGRENLLRRGVALRVQHAHAELYAAVAEQAARQRYGPGHVAAVDRLGAVLDEARAAVTFGLEHDLALAVRLVGSFSSYVEHRVPAEVPQWAERVLQVAAQPGPAAVPGSAVVPGLAAVHGVAGSGARFAGDLVRARALAEAGLAVVDDAGVEAQLHHLLSEVALFEGRLDDAEEAVRHVQALHPAVPEARIVAVLLPLTALYRGEQERAELCARELLADCERFGEPALLAWATYVAGEVLLDADPDRAARYLRTAIDASRVHEDRYLTGVALTSAASLHSRHGDPAEAVHLFREVVEHWSRLGDWTHQWTALRNVVDLLLRLDRPGDAALVHGALTARQATAPTYGADAERMRRAGQVLTARLGPGRLAELHARGGRLGDAEVVATVAGFLTGAGSGGR